LVELIENGKLRVNVELLRPGTYQALSQHLEAQGANFYHIIHLDMHGALLTHKQVEKPSAVNRYLFKGRYGRDDLQPFEGVKAFLAFEGENQGKVDLVEASELAALLTGKGIPVCILNACQSGKQVKSPQNNVETFHGTSLQNTTTSLQNTTTSLQNTTTSLQNTTTSLQNTEEEVRETSLGSRLMSAGMQMVVAMGYSVTVTAARLMMEHLYKHLFADKPITEAIRLSRRELFNVKKRKAHYQDINLEDWLLPVIYYNQSVNFNLRAFTPEEEEKYFETVGSQYRFPLPTYGFVGRDLEILKIEKALLKHNVLLLQGMGGTGKTTLLNYLREWWQKTNFVKNTFYFGYDEKAWTLEQILFFIGQQIYKKFEFARFQAMSQRAQIEKLVAKLRAEKYAVILDNLESVTGQQLAIQNTLPETERHQIRDFIGRFVRGQTLVVLGSRSREEWLQQQTFKFNVYELQGLDQEARTELAEKILEINLPKHKIEKIRQDGDFQKLMKLLAGYPLAMEVVLANLQKQTPQEILQGLQAADVNLDVASEDKTKSILKCVEYSHSNLSPEAQKLLICLAPFSVFIDRRYIDNYINQLQELEPFQDYQFDKFDDAIQEAINWGLLSPMDKDLPWLTIQPVFPYFLKTKLATVDAATREALQEGFKNHYLGLADSYNQLMESKDAQERQLGIFFCRLEYENLYNGLQICLDKQESINIYFCLNEYFKLINNNPSNLKLAETVCKHLDNYSTAFIKSELGYQIPFAISNLANCQLQAQQYKESQKSYEKTLQIYDLLENEEEAQKQFGKAKTYYGFGRVAQKLGEFEEARGYYQLALDIYIKYVDRYEQADVYHQLGYVVQDLREFKEARGYYQLALDIFIEYGDRYSQADTYHELGRVAQKLGEFENARRNYQQALEIDIEYNNLDSQASTYGQLGLLAEAQEDHTEARTNLQKALEIFVEYKEEYWGNIARENLERLPK
jgi:tetratricopeptide (TPR) repeat protein